MQVSVSDVITSTQTNQSFVRRARKVVSDTIPLPAAHLTGFLSAIHPAEVCRGPWSSLRTVYDAGVGRLSL